VACRPLYSPSFAMMRWIVFRFRMVFVAPRKARLRSGVVMEESLNPSRSVLEETNLPVQMSREVFHSSIFP
jgi:hypothetical protein